MSSTSDTPLLPSPSPSPPPFRKVATLTQSWSTTFKSIVGSGICAVPFAIRVAGVLGGSIGIGLVGLWAYYTMTQIIACVYLTRKGLSRAERHKYRKPFATHPSHGSALEEAEEEESDLEDQNGYYPLAVGTPVLNTANYGATTQPPTHAHSTSTHTTIQLQAHSPATQPIDARQAPSRVPIGYQQIGFFAFGKHGKVAIDFILMFSQIGGNIAFVALITSNIHSVFASYNFHFPVIYVLCVLFPILTTLSLPRSTTYLAPTSHLGNIALVSVVLTVFYYGFTHATPWANLTETFTSPETAPLLLFTSINKVLTFIGIAAFALCAHAEVVAVEGDSKDRQSYSKVLASCMFTIVSLNWVFGLFAYAAFGELTQSNILLNLGSGFFVNFVRILLSLVVMCNYPISLFPASQALDNILLGPPPPPEVITEDKENPSINSHPSVAFSPNADAALSEDEKRFLISTFPHNQASESSTAPTSLLPRSKYDMYGHIIRICEVLFTCMVAFFLSDFGTIASVVGSITGGLLCFALPPLFYYRLKKMELDYLHAKGRKIKPEQELGSVETILLFVQVFMGLVLMSSGILVCFQSMQ